MEIDSILVVSTYSPTSQGFGGITSSVTAYLKMHLLSGKKVTFLGPSGSYVGSVKKSDIEILFPGLKVELYDPNFSKKWGLGLGIFKSFLTIAKNDLIVIHGARTFTTIFVGITARLLKKRYIVVSHAGLDKGRMKRTKSKNKILFPMVEPLVRFSVNGAQSIIVSGIVENINIDESFKKIPVEVIENFFEIKAAYTAPLSIREGLIYIFVGRLESDKGILKFVCAWKEAARETDRLVILGTGKGDYAQRVYEQVEGDQRISYLGEVSEARVYDEIRRSHVLVLPTGMDDPVIENFGNVVVEALICSKPVLVTTGMHWDGYEHRKAISVFHPKAKNAQIIVKSFSELRQNEYDEMCSDAQDLAMSFDIGIAKKKFDRLIDEMIRS